MTVVNCRNPIPACPDETVCCADELEGGAALDCEECASLLKPSSTSDILWGTAFGIKLLSRKDLIFRYDLYLQTDGTGKDLCGHVETWFCCTQFHVSLVVYGCGLNEPMDC